MSDLADAILLFSAFALVLRALPAIRMLLVDRSSDAAAFREYFGPEYDRDLLRQSRLSETEEWRDDDDSRVQALQLRDIGSHKPG